MEVVGRVAEVVTGWEWRALVATQLAAPLGLASLDYDLFPVNPSVPGGARATPGDYQAFLRMVLRQGLAGDGSRYLSPASAALWFENQTLGLPEYDSAWPPYPYPYGERPDYGHGSWILAQEPGSGRVEEVASPGVFGTCPWVDRKRRLYGVVATDAPDGFAATVYADLVLLDLLRAAIDVVFLFGDDFESGDASVWTPAP
jgi:CubicO group peptidase (beta-lactamase class C family)